MSNDEKLHVAVQIGEQRSLIIGDVDGLQEKISTFMKKYSNPDMSKMNFETRAKTMTMRTAMKAFLAIAGDMILEMIYGKDRPKIGWDDEALEFYPVQIANGIIEAIVKFRYTLIAQNAEDKFGQNAPIVVGTILAEPVAGSIPEARQLTGAASE